MAALRRVFWVFFIAGAYVPDPTAPKTVCMCGKYGPAVLAVNGCRGDLLVLVASVGGLSQLLLDTTARVC